MPKTVAFQGIRYNSNKVDLVNALCPPYDTISPQQEDEYYAMSEYNAIRLVLGKQFSKDCKTDNRYTRASHSFNQWLAEGILIQETSPAMYYHEHTYTIGEKTHTRNGIIAAVRIDDGLDRHILPHEKTLKAPKLDRLRLMNEVKANLSCAFGIYSDPNKRIENQVKPNLSLPVMDIIRPGESQKLWVIQQHDLIDKISNMMIDKKILIADGHHRYETSKTYRDRMRAITGKKSGNEHFDYTLMYLTNMNEGLTILPTHRLIIDSMGVGLVDLEYRIKEIFNMIPFDNKKTFLTALQKKGGGRIGLYVKGIPRYYLLEVLENADLSKYMTHDTHPLLKRLDVTILHSCIIEPILGIGQSHGASRIAFISNANEALQRVENDKADIVFLLNANSITEIMNIAENGLKMPQKSTYFFPKISTGLVFYPL